MGRRLWVGVSMPISCDSSIRATRLPSGLTTRHSLAHGETRIAAVYTDGMNFNTGNHWPRSVCGHGIDMMLSKTMLTNTTIETA